MTGRIWQTRWLLVSVGIALFSLTGCARSLQAASTGPGVRQRQVSELFDPGLAPVLLDEPGRDRWQKPQQIVDALRLLPGDTVADVGAGSGYLTSYLSRAVGPNGTVYSEDIQQAFVPVLKRKSAQLSNVRVVLGTADDPKLPYNGVDCFVLLTVYHEVQHPVAFLRNLREAARPNARLAIVDFDPNRHGDPPAPDWHNVEERDVLAEAQAAGWKLAERFEFISSQFFLVFRQTG